MSLNPHPLVLTAASERHRAELLALAGPGQWRRPALARLDCRPRLPATLPTRVAGGLLAFLLAAGRQG